VWLAARTQGNYVSRDSEQPRQQNAKAPTTAKAKLTSTGLKTGHYKNNPAKKADLFGGVVEEDGVGFLGAALEGELRAIRRKYETQNLVFGEMGHLAVRATIERLQPEIVHALFANQVDDGLALRCEGDLAGKSALINVMVSHLAALGGIQPKYQLVIELAEFDGGHAFAIG
jgi:hypothetical protein